MSAAELAPGTRAPERQATPAWYHLYGFRPGGHPQPVRSVARADPMKERSMRGRFAALLATSLIVVACASPAAPSAVPISAPPSSASAAVSQAPSPSPVVSMEPSAAASPPSGGTATLPSGDVPPGDYGATVAGTPTTFTVASPGWFGDSLTDGWALIPKDIRGALSPGHLRWPGLHEALHERRDGVDRPVGIGIHRLDRGQQGAEGRQAQRDHPRGSAGYPDRCHRRRAAGVSR